MGLTKVIYSQRGIKKLNNLTVNYEVTAFGISFSAVLASLGLDLKQYIILVALMTIDFLTGIAKAYRLEGAHITPQAMSFGVIGKLLYLLIPLVLALALIGANHPDAANWVVEWAMYALILSEAYSIIGNIYTFKTKTEIHKVDGASYILAFIKARIDNAFNKYTDINKDDTNKDK